MHGRFPAKGVSYVTRNLADKERSPSVAELLIQILRCMQRYVDQPPRIIAKACKAGTIAELLRYEVMTLVNSAVLLVEDEDLIRFVASEALQDEGVRVIAASDAGEALAILEHDAAHVRLMLTDINMPGDMDGLALAHHVHLKWPWIKLLVTSGKVCPERKDMPTGARFLKKPYDLHDMIEQIQGARSADPNGTVPACS